MLDSAPISDGRALTELQLRYLTQLTRLVLKGHTEHFRVANVFDEDQDDWVRGEGFPCSFQRTVHFLCMKTSMMAPLHSMWMLPGIVALASRCSSHAGPPRALSSALLELLLVCMRIIASLSRRQGDDGIPPIAAQGAAHRGTQGPPDRARPLEQVSFADIIDTRD